MVTETHRPSITPEAEEILGKYFPVLDHGFVSLVDVMGGDATIERTARTSYGYGTRKTSKTRGLLRYLMRKRHSSPYEHVELQFHIRAPIFVARQLLRHRTANVNETSGRYSVLPTQFYRPDEWRRQSQSNRQGSSDEVLPPAIAHILNRDSEKLQKDMEGAYTDSLGLDVTRELSRINLPLSLYTEWYWKIDLHNLFHFLSLRCDSHAQWEIRQYANVIAGMVKLVAPLSFEAWMDYQFCGAPMSRMELEVLRDLVRGQGGLANLEDPRFMKVYGMSSREVGELKEKLEFQQDPNFSLDLSAAQTAEYFEDKARAAVPTGGR